MFIFSSHAFDACSLGYTGLLSACPICQPTTSSHRPLCLVSKCQDYRCDMPHPSSQGTCKGGVCPSPGCRLQTQAKSLAVTLEGHLRETQHGTGFEPRSACLQHQGCILPPCCPSLLQPAALLTAVNSGDPTQPCLVSQRHCRHPAPFAP